MDNHYCIYICGVGGQGIIKTSTIIGEAAMNQGLDVVMSEIHGMSQRGGSVSTELKIGGYNSSIMYGECESRGKKEGHCWNSIYDKNGNIAIIDYSNTVYSYNDGQFVERKPYSNTVSSVNFLMQNEILEMPDYHYSNGRIVREKTNRIYATGKTLNKQNAKTAGNKKK